MRTTNDAPGTASIKIRSNADPNVGDEPRRTVIAAADSRHASEAIADVALIFDDTDQIEAQGRADGWDIRLYQLARGRMSGRYWGLSLPGLYLSRGIYGRPLHVTGSAPRRTASLVVPFKAGSTPIYRGQHIDAAQVVRLRRGEEFDLFTGNSLDFVTIHVGEDLLVRFGLAAEDGEAGRQAFEHAVIRPGSGPLANLKRTLRDLLYGGGRLPASAAACPSRRAMASDVMEQVSTTLGAGEPPRMLRAQRNWSAYARQTRDFMEANLCRPLRLEELCQETGISRRSLLYAFQDYFGVSPIQYHRYRRLQAARDQLKAMTAAQTSVTEAATAWGFWHLGRFSTDYKRMFGEMPSDTLARRRTFATRPAQQHPASSR